MRGEALSDKALHSFEPPHFNDLTQFWRSCTYADVHLLILELLHLRMTLRELAGRGREAARVVAKSEQVGGMQAILIASIIVCGLLVWIANVAIGRARTRRAQA
ncbi:hypothetical protein [Burkholderia gladioli]|uniref:hypothetical protein n=1 Tax=Burkholderia gladioli TaxID=28095 RepID=UPI0016406CC1|nr:hypothetical protein [Burkholderia gladioli]